MINTSRAQGLIGHSTVQVEVGVGEVPYFENECTFLESNYVIEQLLRKQK